MVISSVLLPCRVEQGVSFIEDGEHWPLTKVIFVRISYELQIRRAFHTLASLLLCSADEVEGECSLRATPADGVRDLLIKWLDTTKNPTGKGLYDALSRAGCPQPILKIYRRLLKVGTFVGVYLRHFLQFYLSSVMFL